MAKTWPSFDSEGFKSFKDMTEEEKLVDDTYCFHTRMNVSQRKAVLGTGVAFSRVMRTTDINNIYTTVDLLSQKGYKEGVRKSISKRKFTHWIPLFFKQADNDERTIDLFRKNMSEICTGSKDKFEEGMILKVFPKLLLVHVQ